MFFNIYCKKFNYRLLKEHLCYKKNYFKCFLIIKVDNLSKNLEKIKFCDKSENFKR